MTTDYSSPILQQGYNDSRNPAQPEDSGGIFAGITNLLGNLDRPRGAITAAMLAQNPVSGFESPQDYHLYAPTDTPLKKLVGSVAEAFFDPLNLVGAKYLSPMGSGASFAARALGEGAMNAGSRIASTVAQDQLDEAGAPTWLKIVGGLAAGGIAGGGIAGALSAGRGSVSAIESAAGNAARKTPMEALLDENLGQRHRDAF